MMVAVAWEGNEAVVPRGAWLCQGLDNMSDIKTVFQLLGALLGLGNVTPAGLIRNFLKDVNRLSVSTDKSQGTSMLLPGLSLTPHSAVLAYWLV